MTTRELFIEQKELRDQLLSVVKQTWFLQCLAYAKAELMSHPGVTTENLDGARYLETILLTLGDVPEDTFQTVSSGLNYNFDEKKPKSKKEWRLAQP